MENQLETGKNYGGVFGAKKAVYQGNDRWYFEQYVPSAEKGEEIAQKMYSANATIVTVEKDDQGKHFVAFYATKPEATAAASKAINTAGYGTRTGI